MSIEHRYVSIGALCALLALPAGLAGQEASGSSQAWDRDSTPWTLGVYAGAFLIDDDELPPVGMELDSPVVVFGARLGYRMADHWEIEGGYGYSSLTATSEAETGEIDGQLHLYHGVLNYVAPAVSRARVRLSGGLGGMYYSYDAFDRRDAAGEVVELVDTSWANELVLLFGIGFEVDAGERVAFRADARDHLQFCSAEDTPINETEDFSHCPLDSAVLSNPEFTGGIVFRF